MADVKLTNSDKAKKNIFLGHYDDVLDAAKAYNEGAKRLGVAEYTTLNPV